MLSLLSATARGDTSRKNGKEAQQNRDAYVGQELHNGSDKRHMRNARRRATIHVSILINLSARACVDCPDRVRVRAGLKIVSRKRILASPDSKKADNFQRELMTSGRHWNYCVISTSLRLAINGRRNRLISIMCPRCSNSTFYRSIAEPVRYLKRQKYNNNKRFLASVDASTSSGKVFLILIRRQACP